jgi:hypothetical protein
MSVTLDRQYQSRDTANANVYDEQNDSEYARQLQEREDYELAKKMNDSLPKNLRSFIPYEPIEYDEDDGEEYEPRFVQKKTSKKQKRVTQSHIISASNPIPSIDYSDPEQVQSVLEQQEEVMKVNSSLHVRIEELLRQRHLHAKRISKIRRVEQFGKINN